MKDWWSTLISFQVLCIVNVLDAHIRIHSLVSLEVFYDAELKSNLQLTSKVFEDSHSPTPDGQQGVFIPTQF